MGSIRGRKPRLVVTMKAGSDISSGRGSSRTWKSGAGAVPREPIVFCCVCFGGGLCDKGGRVLGEDQRQICSALAASLDAYIGGEAGMDSGL